MMLKNNKDMSIKKTSQVTKRFFYCIEHNIRTRCEQENPALLSMQLKPLMSRESL
jgi:hypothetical protein